MKNIRKITVKMLMGILPIIIVTMLVLTLISAKSSSSAINKQVDDRMVSELNVNKAEISHSLELIKKTTMNISNMVGVSYHNTDMETYVEELKNIIEDNDLILGSGIWFEPYVYDQNEKYMGPYVYKEGEEMVLTYDYSNAEYDYFSQEYYKTVENGNRTAVLTDPYYDEALNTIMASCVAPIYNEDGKFIGVISVDIELSSIQEIVNAIQVGDNGKATLLTSDGTYLSCADSQKQALNAKNAG